MDGDKTRVIGWQLAGLAVHKHPPEVILEGAVVALDRSSLAVLICLLDQAGRAVNKDVLLAAGWPGRVVQENSLAKAIGRLRSALSGLPLQFKAVHGFGYQLNADQLNPMYEQRREAAPVVPAIAVRSTVRHRRFYVGAALVLTLVIALVAVQWVNHQRQLEAKQQAGQLLAFLAQDLLTTADPYAEVIDPTQEAKMRFWVERVESAMDARFEQDPAVLMALHRALASAYSGWGDYLKAVTNLQQARKLAQQLDRRPEVIAIDGSLCNQLRLAGELTAAQQTCELAVRDAERSQAPALLRVQIEHAKLQFELGDYAPAAQTLNQIVLNVDSHTKLSLLADAHWFLGLSLRKLARYSEAENAFKAHIATREQLDQQQHPFMAWALTDYGDFLVEVGRYDDARQQLARAQTIFNATLGPTHVESVAPAYSVGVMHNAMQQWQPAIVALESVLAVYRERLGSDHLWTLYTVTELAFAHAGAGHEAIAERLLRESQATGARLLYGHPAKAAHFFMRWAQTWLQLNDLDQAEADWQQAQVVLTEAYPVQHPLQAENHCLGAALSLARSDLAGAKIYTDSCARDIGSLKMPRSHPLRASLARLNQALSEA